MDWRAEGGAISGADNVRRLSVKRALAILAMLPLLFALAACEPWPPEVDQIAQQSMIGLAKKKILACMGAPFQFC